MDETETVEVTDVTSPADEINGVINYDEYEQEMDTSDEEVRLFTITYLQFTFRIFFEM